MSYKKNFVYRNIPFSSETPQEDFFLADVVSNLYAKSESSKDKIIKVRTVGILESNNGCFFIKQVPTAHNQSSLPDHKQCIQVSVVYMNKTVRCPSMPYPVQLFGRLQWYKHPVIFAQIIQPLSVSMATMLNETLIRASKLHSRGHVIDPHDLDSNTNFDNIN